MTDYEIKKEELRIAERQARALESLAEVFGWMTVAGSLAAAVLLMK